MSTKYTEVEVIEVNDFVTLKVLKDVDGKVVYNIYNCISDSDISLFSTTFKEIVSILTKRKYTNKKKTGTKEKKVKKLLQNHADLIF